MLQAVIWRRETVARLQRLAKCKRPCESPASRTPSQSSPCSPSQLQYCTPASKVHSATAPATLPVQQEYCASMCSSASQQLTTPLDSHGYAKAQTADMSAEQVALTHSYSRKTIREQASHARTSARKTLSNLYDQTPDAEIIQNIKQKIGLCEKVKDIAKLVLSIDLLREEIEDHLLDNMNSSMHTLFGEGDNSSRLGMSLKDDNVTEVLQIAVTEMNKRVPFLFRVLSTASGDSQGKKKELYLGVIYGMLMRQRSQRMNIIQRLITATCLRYHASNEVKIIFLLHIQLQIVDFLHINLSCGPHMSPSYSHVNHHSIVLHIRLISLNLALNQFLMLLQ